MTWKRRITDAELFEIDYAVRLAEQVTRFEFSVFVGEAGDDSRRFAEARHRELLVPDRSVLLVLDPASRRAEIVTGASVQDRISDDTATQALRDLESFSNHHSLSQVVGFLLARLSASRWTVPAMYSRATHSRIDSGWTRPRS